MTQIGHASQDESGRAVSGIAGDQTKREVLIQNWYSHPWHTVIRPKSAITAQTIANTMCKICNNDNIGYDQSQRTTLFEKAKAVKWNIDKIKTPCETDCSATVCVCVNSADISIPSTMYTGNELKLLSDTGKFTILTDDKYTKSPAYLQVGDILLASGHTAVVVSCGDKVKPMVVARYIPSNYLAKFNKQYIVNRPVHIRTGAGKPKESLGVLAKGTKVRCYGKYSTFLKYKWLYVETTFKGITYIGFINKNYLS